MTLRMLLSAVLVLTLTAAPLAQRPTTDAEPTQLPVRRVVLYKSGVGFFEHQGAVTGSVDVAIQFTSGQLNDVLKSLTALDLDNGQISSIGYNSTAPIEQRLAALRLPLDSKPDLLQFYNALRGARVDVQTGTGVVSGRLLGLERKPARDATSEPTDVLTVIANDGSVRSIVLRPNVSVRITERDLRDDISRYLAVVASGRDQDIRRMTLAANGNGTRRLVVSYVSEVPIWKSTYRLVLPEGDAAPMLQGWAVVDNTVGADWTNVELSLVAGAPQSFVQRVSQPYYARRPEVPLPQTVLLNPQTHQATLREGAGSIAGTGSRFVENIVVTGEAPRVDVQNARQATQLQGRVMVDGVVVNGAGGGRGSGIGGQTGGFIGESETGGAAINLFSPQAVQNARQAGSQTAANAQDLGDLFEYRLTQPVTIRTNQSAMVPILNTKVNAERVSIWSRSTGSGRPLRAVWLTNTSGLTLDGGSLSVIDGNAFAGEGLVEPLKPSEKRLVSYGSDLGVMVDARLDESSGRYTRVVARDGVVIAYEETRQGWEYRIRNEDATPRTLVIEHPVRAGWTLNASPAPAETTASAYRFRLPVAARAEATLRLTERLAGESRFSIDQFDDRLIATFGQRGVSMDELRSFLQPIADARGRLADADRRARDLNTQVATVGTDQERMRENIKALGTSRQERTLRDRYIRELGEQEDRLKALQIEIATANFERDRRRDELSALMQKLTFEVVVK